MHLESSVVSIPVFFACFTANYCNFASFKAHILYDSFHQIDFPPFSYPTDMHNNFYHMLDPTEDNMVVVFGPPLPILADLDPQQSVSEGIVEFHTCLTKILPPAAPPAKS